MAISADPNTRSTPVEAADEVTPLLGAASTTSPSNGHVVPPHDNGTITNHDQNNIPDEEKPMPYIQILVICYASLAEPVGYFSIFPFVNEMIQRNGNLNQDDVGFWSGAIESSFSIVQMCLMIFYGRMADRVGRKPVLVFSLFGVSIATAAFGLSRTLWQMILFRCIAGVFAGSVVTSRVMISENTTKLTQGRAFSWYMFTRNMGIFVGPLIGGGLANPAVQFPSIFGGVAFFENYPYALSAFIAGTVCLSAAVLAQIVLKETLVRKVDGHGNAEPPMSTWEVIRAPGVAIVLYIFGHVALLALAYTAVSPVFQFTDIDKGGFSFSDAQIAYFLAIAGLSQSFWMLLVFPPLQRAIGTGNLLRICGAVWPFFMAMYPVLNEIFRTGNRELGLGLAYPLLVLGSGVAMSFTCVQLCVNDISPSPAVVGTVNAISLTINSAIRAVAPALFTSIFALGVKSGWAHGHLIWFFLVAIAATLNVPFFWLPEAAEGRIRKQPSTSNPDDGIAGE